MRHRRRGPLARLKAVPFESLVALFSAYLGLVALLDVGPTATVLTAQLPEALVAALNGGYVIAGLALVYGIVRPRRTWEAFGLSLVLGSVAVRTVALLWLLGFSQDTINGVVLNVMTMYFVGIRLAAVVRGVTIVQVEPEDEGGDGGS